MGPRVGTHHGVDVSVGHEAELMAGSGAKWMRATAASPPTARNASTICATVTVRPGRFSARPPVAASQSARGSSCARSSPSIAASGDSSHSAVSGSTGQIAISPASGSRTMPLAKLEAAAFGLPGRTTIVGRRTARPSM